MLGYGTQFQIGIVATILYDPITKALISHFGGLAMVGYFEMASQMVTKLRSLLIAGNQVLVPIVAAVQERDPSQVHQAYRDTYSVTLYLALPFFAAIVAASPLVSDIWIGTYHFDFVAFAVIIALGWFVNSVSTPAYFANLGTGRLRWNTVSHVATGLLNVVLAFWLGTAFGGLGVVIGWALALASGSMILTTAYHAEHRKDAGTMFPQDYGVLIVACAGGAIWGLVIHAQLASALSIAAVASITALGFVMVTVPALWWHPIRLRLLRWIRAGCMRSNLGAASGASDLSTRREPR